MLLRSLRHGLKRQGESWSEKNKRERTCIVSRDELEFLGPKTAWKKPSASESIQPFCVGSCAHHKEVSTDDDGEKKRKRTYVVLDHDRRDDRPLEPSPRLSSILALNPQCGTPIFGVASVPERRRGKRGRRVWRRR